MCVCVFVCVCEREREREREISGVATAVRRADGGAAMPDEANREQRERLNLRGIYTDQISCFILRRTSITNLRGTYMSKLFGSVLRGTYICY